MGAGGQQTLDITPQIIYRRLFTHEDFPHNVFGIHKFLGIGVLLHYIYRFALTVVKADMGFTASWQTAALLSMHALLSLSSMIFKIPKKRIVEGSRIWPEYRLHSIIFACRSLACMALVWVEQRFQLPPAYEWNIAIVIATIVAADIASWSVGEASRSSTIRDLDAPPALQYFFSVMQFHATAGCLLGIRLYSTQFCYVWVIQFTAFLMTLRRKNLAPHNALVRTYGVMLTCGARLLEPTASAALKVRRPPSHVPSHPPRACCRSFGAVIAANDALSANSWALVHTVANTAAVGRLGCRIDKYVLWAVMAIFVHFARKTVAVTAALRLECLEPKCLR